jgi:LysM repeat protein
MGDRVPGQTCQGTKPVSVQDGGNALCCTPTRGPTRGAEDVSPEIGSSYLPVATNLCLDPAQMQVLAALRSQRSNIIAAEGTFGIDRRAIAGAIAWEMLENPPDWTRKMGTKLDPLGIPRSVGWGKVHLFNLNKTRALKAWMGGGPLRVPLGIVALHDFDTIAKETEDVGYLPKQSFNDRKRILGTPEGAITYIGGIMAAIADIPENMGFDEDIRSNPMILTNVYQGETLKSWRDKLAKKMSTLGKSAPFEPGNDMAIWVGNNLDYLDEAVGTPDFPLTTPNFSSMPGNTIGYVVERGSTLSDIAKEEYGSSDLWPLIWDANKATVGSNPNLIQPGQILSLPPLSRFTAEQIADAKRRAPTWKSFK